MSTAERWCSGDINDVLTLGFMYFLILDTIGARTGMDKCLWH